MEYRSLLRLYLARGRNAAAFRLAELTKGRSLLESVTLRTALCDPELPASEVSRLEALDARVRQIDRELSEAGEPQVRVRLAAARNKVLREERALQQSLRHRFARYAALSQPQIVRPHELRRALVANAVGLSYAVAEGRLVAFTLTRKDALRVHDLGVADDLSDLVSAYRDALSPDGEDALRFPCG